MEMLDEVNIAPLTPFDVGMGRDGEEDTDEGKEGDDVEEDEGDEGVARSRLMERRRKEGPTTTRK
jgi:hypothetical protein